MKTVLRYYLQMPMFGPLSSADKNAPEVLKRTRQSDLDWARSNYSFLREFADSEIIVNHGHKCPIMVVTEHPQVEVDPCWAAGVKIIPDKRLPKNDGSPIQMLELSMHEVEHPGTIIGAREWRPDDKISARSYGENHRGRNGEFEGVVVVQVTYDGAITNRVELMMDALTHARAHALGILAREDHAKK